MVILFLEWVFSIIVAAYHERNVEVMIGDRGSKIVHKMPEPIFGMSMVMHNGTILSCGGGGDNVDIISKSCLQLNSGVWKEHSTLNIGRLCHSVAATANGTFIFGGLYSFNTYEYLPKNSNTWRLGKTEIPGLGIFNGSAIVSKCGQEIWLIGGSGPGTEKRILKFNINDHTFHEMTTQLIIERHEHRCYFIPNTNKILITGGYSENSSGLEGLNSTEIYDTEDGSITMASPMNFERYGHGIGIITINGDDRLAVFGGDRRNPIGGSVELYNTETTKWETTRIKLDCAYYDFGFLEVNLADIISKL